MALHTVCQKIKPNYRKVACTHTAPTSCLRILEITERFSITHLQGVKAPSTCEVRLLLATWGGEGQACGGFSEWLEQHLITSSNILYYILYIITAK